MQKLIASIVCFSVCAVLASAQGGKGGLKVEGSWICTALEFDGKKAPAEIIDKLMPTFMFKDGKYATTVMGKQDESGAYKIDTTKKPAHLDLAIMEGKDKGKQQVGLIAVDGDVLKMALAAPGEKDRPKDFAGGAGIVIVTFNRTK